MPKMSKLPFCALVLAAMLYPLFSSAQMRGFPMPQGEKVDVDVALDRALQKSSLTFNGKPFHAVMNIGEPGTEYSGRIEVWWVEKSKYRLILSSPKFNQEKIVNGDRISEKNEGDYYPRWLENFVLAILDPLPIAKNFRGRGGVLTVGPQITNSCLRRDDRPGGITDQLTWGIVCFSGSEPHLSSVLTMNVSIEFKDWKGFEKKQIARTYETDVLDYKPVTGHLTTLEEIKQPNEAEFLVNAETPKEQRISTEFASTLKEESLERISLMYIG
jgi:hypothetical protein